MSSGNLLPKWQLALVVGAPVAIGLSYMYYRNKNSNDSKISDNRKRKDALSSKLFSIDNESTNKSQIQYKAEVYKNEGNKQFKRGNYKEAISQYEKAIEVCPKKRNKEMAIFYQNKAAAHEQLKNYDAVKEDCTKAVELDPKYTKALLRRARALEKLGEFELALEDVSTTCLIEGFTNPTSLIMADRILEHLGKRQADEDMKDRKYILPSKHYIKNYLASFSKDPLLARIKDIDAEDTPEFFKKLLQALKDEDYDSIKSICDDITRSDEFLTLPPSKMEIVSLQALFESFLGHHDSAFENFDYILKSEDSSKEVKINALIKRATLHIQLNNPEKGYKDFEKAIKLDGKCPDIYHHRGQLYLLQNDLELANSDFDKAILHNPNFAASFVRKYYAEYRLLIKENNVSQIERIVKDFDICFQKFPDYPESYLLYAQMMLDIGNYEKADIYFVKALDKDPDNAAIYVHRGLLELHARSLIDQTVECIKQAIEIDPKCELAYETLASIEVQRGNLEEAIRLFDETLRLAHSYQQLVHLYSLRHAAKTQLTIKNRVGDI